MYDTILVPTDGSDASLRAADEALRIARAVGADVHVLYVVDESASSFLLSGDTMADVLAALREEGEAAVAAVADRADGVSVTTEVGRGTAVHEAILDYADREGADLVVMGTRGRRGLDQLMGSTTERVTAEAPIPVLVVGPDAESEE